MVMEDCLSKSEYQLWTAFQACESDHEAEHISKGKDIASDAFKAAVSMSKKA